MKVVVVTVVVMVVVVVVLVVVVLVVVVEMRRQCNERHRDSGEVKACGAAARLQSLAVLLVQGICRA
ncbi:hypothetical protein E2C01_053098 [Portunus trituberculatus]|uniref:Uncharacterized protein n=1 Tax=Portunus trituberculatus TaxID=210409 RepID=A0A5B7GNF0_PORTR|nr:hypothetical protein [Portunus trituberculatus]